MNHSQRQPPALLAPIDRHFAGLMSRLSENSPHVRLAAALVSHSLRLGHICVDFEAYRIQPPPMAMAAELGQMGWPDASKLLEAIKRTPVVGRPHDFKPLILDAQNRLYLHRYWKYESDLAASIARLAQGSGGPLDLTRLKEGLNRLFPKTAGAEIDWQMVAVFAAMRRQLCIVYGGPGTGKTRTVVLMLALLLEQNPAMRIALAAPTGKAAARLQDAVKNAKASLPCLPEIKERMPTEAGTVHRLLGALPGSAGLRHDAERPLPYDMVVLDEASMVDLPLMAKLVAAVPRSGKLVLLGDKDQLASVDAGAVLADFCNGGEPRRFSDSFLKELAAVSNQTLPLELDFGRAVDLADCIVELRRNYRFSKQSDISRLSRAVNQGNSAQALAVLNASRDSHASDISWKPLPSVPELKEALKSRLLAGCQAFLQAPNPTDALQAFGRFRLLCALRSGPYGVENLNRLAEEILAEAGWISTGAPFYAGRPVMVVRNLYALRIFNGEIGIIRPNARNELRACFAGPEQAVREILPLRLPEHETAYAMTVHKSQGSEFEKVLLILPGEDSPVLTRELLYTGLTRARAAVEIWSDAEIFTTAVRRKTSRRSGLREALWGGPAATPSALGTGNSTD